MDYKITANVDKEAYIKLRGKLLMQGKSFSEWLREKISQSLSDKPWSTGDPVKDQKLMESQPEIKFNPVPKPK